MNFIKKSSYTYNGEIKEYHYSPTATLSEQIAFVEMVSNGVFIDNSYLPLLKSPVFDYWIIATFTDIDMSNFTDIDAFDKFNKETKIATYIGKELSLGLLKSLTESVDANIEYKKSIAHDNISTAIVDLINVAKNKIEAWDNGIDNDKLLEFMEKFNQSGLNSEGIAKAYFDNEGVKKNMEVIDKKNADIRDLKQKLNDVTAKNVLADKSDKVIPIKGE